MNDRRLLLTRALKILALIGLGFMAYPFIAALLPDGGVDSDRRRQWLREIDLSGLRPGELLAFDDWPGGPVAVYRRTAVERDALLNRAGPTQDPPARDTALPADFDARTRSLLADYFVFVPIDRTRGCRVRHLPAEARPAEAGRFVNPCTGGEYDAAGVVISGAGATDMENLRVPNQRLLGKLRIQLLPD
jgi:Rieske Fe-S protein